jgi:signal transduction histidine kinase
MLILLPVVVLTSAGIWALRQDRRLVQQEARERAYDFLSSLTNQIRRQLPSTLRRTLSEHATEWPLLTCRWDQTGQVVEPPEYPDPPSPAGWLNALTKEQRTAWNRLHETEVSGDLGPELDDVLGAFLALDPPEPALAAARFLVTRHQTALSDDTGPAQELFSLARAHPAATTASGVPLIAIATGRLLTNPITEDDDGLLLEGLRSCVLESPSTLTPLLLRRAIAQAEVGAPQRMEKLSKLRFRWEYEHRLRQLARRVSQRVPSLRTPGTVWIKQSDGWWLAVFGPTRSSIEAGSTDLDTSPGSSAQLLPQLMLEQALGSVLGSRPGDPPSYAHIHLTVDGRAVSLPHVGTLTDERASKSQVLAFTKVAIRPLSLDEDGTDEGQNHGPQAAIAEAQAPFTLQLALHLTDPVLLYARKAQRRRLFGGLILAAAAAAVIGLAGAYRAFHRQLHLAELKSNFVSSVSHELRAPIASVQLLAESLERNTVSGAAKRQEYIGLIGQECRRLSALIENVLDFSRIDQGRKHYEFESTNLSALVHETIRLMTPYATEHEVPLQLDGSTADVECTADGRALQQALVNLIDNAIKHSPTGKPVRVALTCHEGAIRLSVSDQGPGIPDEDHERIFEPFYRRGSELRRDTQGLGIGLSIVRHVVKAHEGRVTVENTKPIRGTCFTLTLPVLSPLQEP